MIYEVWHNDSPGMRVFVRRGRLRHAVMSLLSESSFAAVGERHIDPLIVDEYVSLIPIEISPKE